MGPLSAHTGSARLIFGVLLVLVIAGYILFEARRFLEGPVLTIESPATEGALHDQLLDLRVATKNVASISVNGRNTFINEEGQLKEQLLLPPGYTILTIAALDRFGHETTKTLELYTN